MKKWPQKLPNKPKSSPNLNSCSIKSPTVRLLFNVFGKSKQMYHSHPVFGSLQRKHYLDILGGKPFSEACHCTALYFLPLVLGNTTKIIREIWNQYWLENDSKTPTTKLFSNPMSPFQNTSLLSQPIQPILAWPHRLAGNSKGARGIWKWFEWQFFSTVIFISKLVSNLYRNLQCSGAVKWYLHPKIEQSRAYM